MEKPPEFGGEPRLLGASEWRQQRWGWLESVRRDATINPMARLVAHVLALDFVNVESMRCDPRMTDIADALSTSPDTADRAVKALIKAGWVVAKSGRGRGNHTSYGFLTRAKIVALKGGKSAALKGGKSAGFCGSEKGADLRLKGGKSAGSYIKDKPCNNHKGRAGAQTLPQNPVLHAQAEAAVERFRRGDSRPFEDLAAWVVQYIIAADLLTDEERQRSGIC